MLFIISQLLSTTLSWAMDRPATAFFYGSNLPLDMLSAYPRVVVEPESLTDAEIHYLKQQGTKVYAYFSIGEIGPERSWLKDIPAEWILGHNPGWKSSVMDLSKSGWQHYLINQQLQALKNRGFDNFFLDTLDSFQLFAKSSETQKQQQAGLIEIIRAIKAKWPETGLLFNRGFEVIDQVANLCDGVVAESLFKAWDPGKSSYRDVKEADRSWLTNKLKDIQNRWQLPIIIIDYLPPNERDEAEKIAQKIKSLGFIPWVSTPALDYMGVGELNLIPRKILMLYDSKENKLAYSNIHRFMSMPVENLGYVPEYVDINSPLPNYILQGRYAGIISWTLENDSSKQKQYGDWLNKQILDHVRVVFMNTFPFFQNNTIKQTLKLDVSQDLLAEPIEVLSLNNHVGYEIAPLKRRLDLLKIQSKSPINSWIRVSGKDKGTSDPVFTADWGGLALSPYLFIETESNQITGERLSRWIIDPFAFIKEALALENLPVADNTTENGRRILTVHIDGDGFYNKSELNPSQYSPEIITDNFIKPSQWPHTVSIIEGEIAPHGLKPELSQTLEAKARQIFALPNVEIASHTYSHPFLWAKASDPNVDNSPPFHTEHSNSLSIPGYEFDPHREIAGSIDYINKRLAPLNKTAKVLLWSGDALPNEETLRLTEKLHIFQMNGGSTFTRNGVLSLTNIAPMGITQGAAFQPYAPVQNENTFTNNWLGPFYGYQDVIDTFKLTDSPRRLKPISIYYHFYIGDKLSSFSALQRVYAWAASQESLPLWISEYIPRLYGFREAVYEKRDHGWKIYHAEALKTLRLTTNASPPLVSASTGIAGYRLQDQGLYVSLNGEKTVEMNFGDPAAETLPLLDNSNVQIDTWNKKDGHIRIRMIGHEAVKLAFANFNNHCQLQDAKHKILTGLPLGNTKVFAFSTMNTDYLDLSCA